MDHKLHDLSFWILYGDKNIYREGKTDWTKCARWREKILQVIGGKSVVKPDWKKSARDYKRILALAFRGEISLTHPPTTLCIVRMGGVKAVQRMLRWGYRGNKRDLLTVQKTYIRCWTGQDWKVGFPRTSK